MAFEDESFDDIFAKEKAAAERERRESAKQDAERREQAAHGQAETAQRLRAVGARAVELRRAVIKAGLSDKRTLTLQGPNPKGIRARLTALTGSKFPAKAQVVSIPYVRAQTSFFHSSKDTRGIEHRVVRVEFVLCATWPAIFVTNILPPVLAEPERLSDEELTVALRPMWMRLLGTASDPGAALGLDALAEIPGATVARLDAAVARWCAIHDVHASPAP